MGQGLHGQEESEPEEKDLGESDQRLDLSKTSKARSRNVLLTQLCLIKGRCGFETGEILSKESANHDGATEIAMTRSFQIVADFCGRFFNGQSFVSSRTVHQQRCTMSERIFWLTKDTISAIDRSWPSNWCWILLRCKWGLPQLKY